MEKIKGFIRSFDFEIKSTNEEKRLIEGYFSTKDLDRDDDIVEPEAFKKSLKSFISKNGVVLYNHRRDTPIGKVIEGNIDDKGAFVVVEIAKNVPDADNVWELIKQGVLKTFSFGFVPLKVEWCEGNGKEVRILKEVDLLEVSIVSVPANPNAVFTIVEGKTVNIEFEGINPFDEKAVCGDTSLPLTSIDRYWSRVKAVSSVRKWASSDGSGDKDKINWSKYKKAFFWYDENKPEEFTSYKLPFAEAIDGKLYAVPRGIMTVAAVLQGARGGVNIPEEDIEKIKRKVEKYYEKMDMVAPWKKEFISLDEVISILDVIDETYSEKINCISNKLDKAEKQLEKLNKTISELNDIKSKVSELNKFKQDIDKKSSFSDKKSKEIDNLDKDDEFYNKLYEEVKDLLNTLKN